MSLLPRSYLDTTVAIEVESPEGGEIKYRTIGTGFLIGFDYGDRTETGGVILRVFTVTNRHVLAGKDAVWVRVNKKGGTSKRYGLALKDGEGKSWIAHRDKGVDVAVVMTAVRTLQEEGMEFNLFRPDDIAFLSRMRELGIAPGEEIFVLGFPMGISGVERNYVIARGGIVARFDEEILNEAKGFLIDSAVFPGSSGGPVIVKPTVETLEGSMPVTRAYLIGVVKGYIPYQEVAYSLQTEPPTARIAFVENSGLANVVPMDFVKETADSLMAEAGPAVKPPGPKVVEVKEGDAKLVDKPEK